MSALFNFSSFVVVILLAICTCAYVKGKGGPRFCPVGSRVRPLSCPAYSRASFNPYAQPQVC